MMTQRIAFHIIKALEIISLSHSVDNALDYDVVCAIHNPFDTKLIIAADWLFDQDHLEVMMLIKKLFKVSKSDEFKNSIWAQARISISKKSINDSNVDYLAKLSSSETSQGSFDKSYFVSLRSPISATPYEGVFLSGTTNITSIESGFLLKSKLLPSLCFNKSQRIQIGNDRYEELTPRKFNKENHTITFSNEKENPIEYHILQVFGVDTKVSSDYIGL